MSHLSLDLARSRRGEREEEEGEAGATPLRHDVHNITLYRQFPSRPQCVVPSGRSQPSRPAADADARGERGTVARASKRAHDRPLAPATTRRSYMSMCLWRSAPPPAGAGASES